MFASPTMGRKPSRPWNRTITIWSSSGLISSPAGLSVLLGADLGSALVVRFLSFEISSLIPFLLLVGVALFLASRMRSARQAGRIIIGIALILVALQMIGIASEPLRESKAATAFIAFFAGEPVTAFLIAALATWFLHSSIAAVLVVASFAGNGLLPVELALILVLGINAGSGIIAALLTKNHEREIWLIPLSNLFIRAVLAVVFLAAIIVLGTDRFVPDMAPDAIVISGHILFNVVVVAAGLPAVRPVLMIVDKFVPPDRDSPSADPATEQQHRSSLDPNMVKEPKQAIGNAMREILTMSNTVSMMLHGVLDAFSKGDKAEITGIAKLDDEVDQQRGQVVRRRRQVGRSVLRLRHRHDRRPPGVARRLSARALGHIQPARHAPKLPQRLRGNLQPHSR